MRDKIDRLRWFIEDHLKEVGIVLLILVGVIAGIGIMMSDRSASRGEIRQNTVEQLEHMEELSEELREVFSELRTVNRSTNEGNVVLDVSLFLKQPFISEPDLIDALNLYIEALKHQHNDDSDRTWLTGVRIDIFDRVILFDRDLDPRATAYFMLNNVEVDDSQRDEFIEFEDITALTWDATVVQTGRPDYSGYQLRLLNFSPLQERENIIPLSDEEFAFYLKLNKYSALMGSTTGGAQLYLQWDLGQVVHRDGIAAVVREFTDFTRRQTDIGGRVDFFENTNLLRRELAISSPQFLVFAETGEIIDDREEAMARLIDFNAALYADTIRDYIEQRADEIDAAQDGEEEWDEEAWLEEFEGSEVWEELYGDEEEVNNMQ